MYGDALFALWFFAPAGVANVTPILAAKMPFLKGWSQPLDGGAYFRGKRVFGDNKTWRGLITGIIAGTLVFWLQTLLFEHSQVIRNLSQPLDYSQTFMLALGPLMSTGALTGDAVKSFFKRQFQVDAGHSWLPWDQVDYIIGGLLWSALVVRLSLWRYAWIIVVWVGLHLLASYIGYLTNHKAEPI